MKIEFVSKPANTAQFVNTPSQMVIICDNDSLGLTKANFWSDDKTIIVETTTVVSPTHIIINHDVKEREHDGEIYPANSVSINIAIQDDRIVITEDWETWEEDQTICVDCSGDQQVEVVEYLLQQLTTK